MKNTDESDILINKVNSIFKPWISKVFLFLFFTWSFIFNWIWKFHLNIELNIWIRHSLVQNLLPSLIVNLIFWDDLNYFIYDNVLDLKRTGGKKYLMTYCQQIKAWLKYCIARSKFTTAVLNSIDILLFIEFLFHPFSLFCNW
jgi:hypothetical protein